MGGYNMDYIISTDKLTRRFGGKCAVNQVSLHIKQGEIYGLIGRNGAGKTTILKMAGGLIRPSSGVIEFCGEPIGKAISDGKLAKVGTLIENPGLLTGMTGHDNIRMKCICAGINYDDNYIHSLLETVGLAGVEFKKAGTYSLGMKQRLGIALALVGEPDVLILDEPINGLDPQGIAEVRDILLKLHRERNMTILISSHILEELAKLVTTCGIIDNGVLLREFSREEMERECRTCAVIRTEEAERAAKELEKIDITDVKITEQDRLEVYERTDDTPLIINTLSGAGVPIREVFLSGQTLEEFFFSIVGGKKNA